LRARARAESEKRRNVVQLAAIFAARFGAQGKSRSAGRPMNESARNRMHPRSPIARSGERDVIGDDATKKRTHPVEETKGERGRKGSERIGRNRLCDRKARQTVEGPEAQGGLCPFSCVAEVF